MHRTLVGICIGAVVGMLAWAGFGFWAGWTHGSAWVGRDLEPGWEAAFQGAFVYTAYFWWLAGSVGGFIGGLAGMGSWLARGESQAGRCPMVLGPEGNRPNAKP